MRSEKGALTIFHCIIFAALLMLTGLLIDAARIATAEKKVQSALNTSVRSVLAGYHPELIGEYGIFGVDTGRVSDVQERFRTYLAENLNGSGSKFSFVKYEIQEDAGTEIESFGNLLTNENFKQQIMEYMKYRGPINITGNIINKFTSSGLMRKLEFSKSEKKVRAQRKELSKNVDEANKSVEAVPVYCAQDGVDSLQEARKLLSEAESARVKIEEQLEKYASEAEKSDTRFSGDGSGEMAAGIVINREDMSGIHSEIETLREQIGRNAKRIDEAEERIAGLEKEISRLDDEISALSSRIRETEKQIEEIERAEDSRSGEKDSDDESGSDNKGSTISGSGKGAGNDGEETGTVNDQRKMQLIRELDDLNQQLVRLNSERSRLKGTLEDVKRDFRLEDMQHLSLNDEKPHIETDVSDDKDSTNNILDSIKNGLSAYLKKLEPSMLIDERAYQEAAETESEMTARMELKASGGQELEEEAEINNDGVLEYLENMLDTLKEMAKGGMEKLYLTEYIMDRFTYLTSETERDRFFRKGEVEYILWGGSSELGNIAKTMSVVWILRFSIDTVDAFATSPIPEPVSRLISSLVKGFAASCKDMVELYRGKQISLCPSLKNAVTVSYSDHLRVFLLINCASESGENKMLDNTRQLIHVNIRMTDPSFRLENCNSIIHGKARVKIDLWFIPEIGLEKLGIRGFEDGRYIIEKEIYTGY